jgi:glycosyltransferase involved in cell wall biosynthesis
MVRTIPHGASPLSPPDRELVEELRRELGAHQRAVLLCFGTLRRSKGIPVLLDAIAKLQPDARPLLVVAGHPTRSVDPQALERQVDLLGIRSSVVFDFRYIPDVELAALLEVSALVVLPYLSATQSGAMHLAIAHGTPVLATNVGGLAEGIRDRVDGRLVPPQDPQALATAIGELIQDPSALATMGERARARYLDERSWARCGRALVTTYSEWLGVH